MNPVLVTTEGVTALDARILVGPVPDGASAYGHLALRPYPEDMVSRVVLPDGSACLLRPIKPEDEPLGWSSSAAARRTRSICASAASRPGPATKRRSVTATSTTTGRWPSWPKSRRRGDAALLGIGRLAADPMRESAEYAVLVGDPWQDRGLGGVLTDHCLAIARGWGLRRITAVTTTNNPRMIAVFEKRGFRLRYRSGRRAGRRGRARPGLTALTFYPDSF